MGGGNSCPFWAITWIMYGKIANFKVPHLVIYIPYHLKFGEVNLRFTPTNNVKLRNDLIEFVVFPHIIYVIAQNRQLLSLSHIQCMEI